MLKIWRCKISFHFARSLLFGSICLWMLFLNMNTACASERVVLQLAWKHQFQFAGYYAALHKGYYRQAGLDVVINEGGEGRFAREKVFSGRAQYGVAGAELILYRADGEPAVVLAPVFQHSPSILLTRRDSGISNLQDLIGKRVMLLPGKKDADILAAFLNEGVSIDSIQRIDQSYNLEDLIEGRTDAVSAYITNEPWHLQQTGIEPKIISPQTYGVDFYSDCLFTTEHEIEKHSKRVKYFLEASLQGWEYAMSHTDEIIDLILTNYDLKKNREHLHYEAKAIRKIMLPELVQIGHTNPGRWRHIADTYAKLGMLDCDFALEGFLYDSHARDDHRWLKRILGFAIAISLLVSAVAFVLLCFNRKLSSEVKERKRIEEELRASEEKLRNIVENSTNLFYSHTAEHELTYLSPQAREFLQCEPEEAMVRWTEFATDNPINRKGFELTEKAIQTGERQAPYELEVVGKKGKKIFVEVRESPIVKDGKTVMIVGSLTDITKRKQAEKTIEEWRNRYQVAVDASGQILYDWDSVTNEVVYGGCLEAVIGYTQKEMAGGLKRWMKLIHPDDLPDFKALIRNVVKTGKRAHGVYRVQKKNGEYVYLEDTGDFFQDAQGNMIRMMGFLKDITLQIKLEEQLRQAQKMESVGRLAGGVAHDYNNALSVITGFTELAMEETDPNGPLHANLVQILTAAKRAANITRQLLAFARKQTIAPKVLDLNENVEGMLKMLRRLIGEDIKLTWAPGTSLWPVRIDPSQIDQILANLCVNARDAITGVGDITIETEKAVLDEAYCAEHAGFIPGEFVQMSVSDSGIGMDEEILKKIFEPFFTTKDVDKGTGLGLSTVYGIVKQNSGFINIYSEPDLGTTVKVYFPRHKGKIIHIPEEERNAEIPSGRGETVLIVEDEHLVLEFARKVLNDRGYTVLTADTPGKAVHLAGEHAGAIDLLVTDVVMPEMNGRELAEHLQSLYPNIRRLFMSGYTANVIAHHGVLDKDVYFIQKPFSVKELAKAVRKALDEQKTG